MSNILGIYPSQSQLPPIDGVQANVGDCALTADAAGFWQAVQPSAPPGARPAWSFLLTMRGVSGGQGLPGAGSPGPQGQIGPPGAIGAPGPTGPAGKNSFSFTSQQFAMGSGSGVLVQVTDSSWMQPGQLVFIPNAGTFTVVGAPPNSYSVTLANSLDPNNQPIGTIVNAGSQISPANMRGPLGPAGPAGAPGPPGPQGVSGAAAYTTLTQPFTIPAAQGTAFVASAAVFAVGMIVYVAGGDYFSVVAVNTTANSLTLQNQNFPGGAPIGTIIPVGATVSGTGPQGPQGPAGPIGPPGVQGATGSLYPGVIFMYGGVTPPASTLKCDGSAVSRTQYSRLFSAISTTYGVGDGVTTFNLPNLVNRVPFGYDSTGYPLGSTGGEINHTLVVAELAAHAHTVTATQDAHSHTDTGHVHYCSGVDHLHGDDHAHVVTAGQGSHAHNIVGAAQGFGGGSFASWDRVSSGHSTDAATLPAMSTNFKSQQGYGATTQAADRSLAFNTNAAAAALTAAQPAITASETSIGSGTPHNNLPPFLCVQFCIQT